MALDLLVLAAGLLLLIFGGESLVRGSTALARALGVSPLVIGLTVVAFGTSAPELAVCVIAAWQDSPGIAFGNIIGSNMANVGLIVGAVALVRPIQVTGVVVAREIPMMLLATAAAVVMGLDSLLGNGADLYDRADVYDRADGLVLLMFFLVFLYYTVGEFARGRAGQPHSELHEAAEEAAQQKVGRNLAISAAGLAALVGGADLTVEGAVGVARAFGVSESVIGMTVIAVGTSLPELVASIVASIRGHADLAIGNVVGSNIFNLLLVAGATSVVHPIAVPPRGHLDLGVMALLSLALFLVSGSNNRQIIRGESALLLVTYLGYVGWRALGSVGRSHAPSAPASPPARSSPSTPPTSRSGTA